MPTREPGFPNPWSGAHVTLAFVGVFALLVIAGLLAGII